MLLVLAARPSLLPVVLDLAIVCPFIILSPPEYRVAITLGFGLASLAQQLPVYWRIRRVVAVALIVILIGES